MFQENFCQINSFLRNPRKKITISNQLFQELFLKLPQLCQIFFLKKSRCIPHQYVPRLLRLHGHLHLRRPVLDLLQPLLRLDLEVALGRRVGGVVGGVALVLSQALLDAGAGGGVPEEKTNSNEETVL